MGLFLKGLGTFWHHLKIRLSSNLQISQGAEKQLKGKVVGEWYQTKD